MTRKTVVPLNALQDQYRKLKTEIDEAVLSVLEKQNCILGEEVETFEKELASYVGVPYAAGVSSGTDALIVSLIALGIGRGDEVITTPFTFFATATAILRVGAKVILADIEPNSFNIDPKRIEEKITSKTKCIIPVHIFGQAADMDAIMDIAEKHNLRVIEDAAQAIGASYKGRRVGSFGDTGCFSFFPAKNLGCAGDGGIVTMKDESLYKKIGAMRNHGSTVRYYYNMLGGNFRLDTIQAAILSVKLKHLDDWTQKRRTAAKTYSELISKKEVLKKHVTLPEEVYQYSVYNQFTIRVKQRDELLDFLAKNGVSSAIYYPVPIHLQKALSDMHYQVGEFELSEQASEEVLSIPIFPEITKEQQEYVVKQLEDFYT